MNGVVCEQYRGKSCYLKRGVTYSPCPHGTEGSVMDKKRAKVSCPTEMWHKISNKRNVSSRVRSHFSRGTVWQTTSQARAGAAPIVKAYTPDGLIKFPNEHPGEILFPILGLGFPTCEMSCLNAMWPHRKVRRFGYSFKHHCENTTPFPITL